MTFYGFISVFNYALVLVFGLFLSVFISGGWENSRQKKLIFILCPIFMLIQSPFWLVFGLDTAKKLYPLIVHLPLALILIFALKKSPGVAFVSVFTAYLCCQLPRWANLCVTSLTGSALAGEICYTVVIWPIFYLLYRFFVRAAHDAMTVSKQSLLLFGSLPAAYYVFDYATVVYSDALYSGASALVELLPTVLIIFYVMFLAAYHRQLKKRSDAEIARSLVLAELKQSEAELDSMRRHETQTAIYQHDMRHHLGVIESCLSSGMPDKALDYIHQFRRDLDAVSPKRYCENELVNLLCASFSAKAADLKCEMHIDAVLPKELPITDTELCSIISNGLENALNAVKKLPEGDRGVSLYCGMYQNKLLIEIKNPCREAPEMKDGLPVSKTGGHGYGCLSIQTIANKNRGFSSFESQNGVFTLRVVLPLAKK